MTPKEIAEVEAYRQAKSKWHWSGSKGSYILERYVFSTTHPMHPMHPMYPMYPMYPNTPSPSRHLVAGELYRTQRAVGNGMYQKVWGVRRANDPTKYTGWDYSTFETIAHLDWMPYTLAQQTAMVLLLAGLDGV